MAAADVERFRAALAGHTSVVLDTNVLIYHLEGLEPYVALTRVLITELATGALEALISTLSVAELLVGPYRHGDSTKVQAARGFVEGLPNTTLADVTVPVADRAAWLRTHGLRTPDALVLGTALVHGADGVLTNDPGLRRGRIRGVPPVLLLDDYCPGLP